DCRCRCGDTAPLACRCAAQPRRDPQGSAGDLRERGRARLARRHRPSRRRGQRDPLPELPDPGRPARRRAPDEHRRGAGGGRRAGPVTWAARRSRRVAGATHLAAPHLARPALLPDHPRPGVAGVLHPVPVARAHRGPPRGGQGIGRRARLRHRRRGVPAGHLAVVGRRPVRGRRVGRAPAGGARDGGHLHV
ncbi:MAG: Transcriptional regulator, AcrR family, partial [uncultured Blastococcus sp.]